MSVEKKNYKVEFLDNIVSPGTPIDITDFVVTLDELNLYSTGIISDAKLTLNAEFGQFTTNAFNPAIIPVITQFSRFRITILDDNGVEKSNRILEVTTDLAQLSNQSSHFLPLELEGRERNLSGIPFGGFLRNSTHKSLGLDIILAYQRQAQIPPIAVNGKQPIISFGTNDLPDFNPNIWDFTQVDNCFDALMMLVDHANLPVSAGGGGARYAVIFYDDGTFPLDILRVDIIKQGENNSAPYPVLEQNATNPIMKIDKIKQNPTGSIAVARGRPKTGGQPMNFDEFVSKLEFYRNIKEFDNTIAYPQDSYIKFNGLYYQANSPIAAGNPPPFVSWVQIDVGDYIGIFQYSPFTINKLGPIKNGFANPTGGFDPNNFDSIAIPDHNLVIRDNFTNREWVLFRSNTTLITGDTYLNKYLFNETDFVEGTTCLVDTSLGAVGGAFVGNDINGVPFANNIAVFRIPPNSSPALGEWIVQRQTQDYDQCAVYAEGRVFEWNVASNAGDRIYPGNDRRRGGSPGVFAWHDLSGFFMGNDCFHNPANIEQVDGLFGSRLEETEPLNDPLGNPYIQNSGIKITFGYNQAIERPEEHDVWFKLLNLTKTVALGNIGAFLLNLTAQTFTTFTTPNYTNMGWWFAFPSPYPLSTHNFIVEEIGQLYGGDVNTLNRHRYFDMFNIRYTTTGQEGWTHNDSKDLGEITGVKFLFNFDIKIDGNRIPFTGDIPFAYWALDDQGTLWKSEKKLLRHLGETQTFEFEFGDLTPVFRTRTPLGLQNAIENIIVPELETNEVLFKDRIIIQGFQCETPYDEFGRYSPNLFEQIIKPVFFDAFSGGSLDVAFEGIIDGFRWVKTPIAIAKSGLSQSNPAIPLSDERTIIPNFFDLQNIVNTEQLQRFAEAQVQIESFPYEQYTVEQGGIDDFNLEDTITLHDEYLINDTDEGANTRNLAVRELHFSDLKDRALVRKAVLTKVIE